MYLQSYFMIWDFVCPFLNFYLFYLPGLRSLVNSRIYCPFVTWSFCSMQILAVLLDAKILMCYFFAVLWHYKVFFYIFKCFYSEFHKVRPSICDLSFSLSSGYEWLFTQCSKLVLVCVSQAFWVFKTIVDFCRSLNGNSIMVIFACL